MQDLRQDLLLYRNDLHIFHQSQTMNTNAVSGLAEMNEEPEFFDTELLSNWRVGHVTFLTLVMMNECRLVSTWQY